MRQGFADAAPIKLSGQEPQSAVELIDGRMMIVTAWHRPSGTPKQDGTVKLGRYCTGLVL